MNKQLELQKSIFQLVKDFNICELNSEFIQFDNDPKLIQECKNIKIDYEEISDKLRLFYNNLNIKIYENITDFVKNQNIAINDNILILNKNKPYSYCENTTYINFKKKNDVYLFSNAIAYIDFISFLKEQDKEIENGYHFVDVYKRDFRKISFINLSDKGRLDVSYNIEIPMFDEKINFSHGIDELKSCFSEIENNILPKFVKSSLINIASNYSSNSRFQLIFENLSVIIHKAKVNFEVYINNLSIDKIKKEYDDIKSKYFNELSEILSKLSNKIIALPFGIVAIVYTVYQIIDTPIFLWVALISIVVSSVYLSTLLKIHISDLSYISYIFKIDYKVLTENKFFAKYPNERKVFNNIKNKIENRVNLLMIITESYYWILSVSNIAMVLIILNLLEIENIYLYFIGIVFFILIWIFRNFIMQKENLKF